MLLVLLRHLRTVQAPEIQKTEASSCAHLNAVNVELCPGFGGGAGAGWMQAPCVSAHTDGSGFPIQSERLFCCAGEIPASQAASNRTSPQPQAAFP